MRISDWSSDVCSSDLQQYLDGEIDRATAVALTQKYQLVSPQRAEQSVSFTDQYRSYVINYGLGEPRVRAWIERGRPSRDVMWRRLATIVSDPTLPSDSLARCRSRLRVHPPTSPFPRPAALVHTTTATGT